MPKGMGYSMYPELNDEAWLREQYLTKRLSAKQIGKLVGVKTSNSVRQALKKYQIPVRTLESSLYDFKADDGFVLNMPVLTGCLLGDGFMKVYNRQSNTSYPSFRKKNKHLDHIQFVASRLFSGSFEDRLGECWTTLNGKRFMTHTVTSQSRKDLLPLFRSWYPESNQFKKLVPRDIDINPEALLHWFLDDGSSYMRTRGYREIVIRLSSEGFSRSDNEFLAEYLNARYGFKFGVEMYSRKKVPRLKLPQSQADLFYEVIGACPVPSMQYKWK